MKVEKNGKTLWHIQNMNICSDGRQGACGRGACGLCYLCIKVLTKQVKCDRIEV